MNNILLTIPVLIIGYLVITVIKGKSHTRELSGQELFIQCAGCGALFYLIGYAIARIIIRLQLSTGIFSTFATSLFPENNIITVCHIMLVTLSALLIPFFAWVMVVLLPEQAGIKTALFRYFDKRHVHIVLKNADKLTQLLCNAGSQEKYVLLTTEERKVYIGLVRDVEKNRHQQEKYVILSPVASGYRHPDSLIVELTTFYDATRCTTELTLPMDHIISCTIYEEAAFNLLNAKNPSSMNEINAEEATPALKEYST